MQGTFKKEYSLEKRIELSSKIRNKHSHHVPIIVETTHNSSIKLDRYKFLVPGESSVGNFLNELRSHCKLRPDEAIFIFCKNNILVPTTAIMNDLHDKYKEEDGFLYIIVTLENTFGQSNSF